MSHAAPTRDPADAFWDADDPPRRVRIDPGHAIIAAAVAIIGLSWWSHTRRRPSGARHIVPSAADIHVRPPPPR